MGFNTKTMEDGKEYNLNLSYENIIKPVLERLKIQFIRADEIMLSEIIDESMYKLLLCTDLVIADITTLNPNALYELGVRYALKPYSTILIGDKNTKFPFDINHLRIFTYKHLGNEIEDIECARMKQVLTKVIKTILLHGENVDSPVYKYIEGLVPPICPRDENYFKTVTERFKASDNLCNLVNLAYRKRDEGDFITATKYYKKAFAISKDEYIIKEIAVCTYQDGTQNSYMEALRFLKEQIDIDNTTNPEILKTLGTIYKNLWLTARLEEYAQQALTYYEKSFILFSTYNNGLNYGLMLLAIACYQSDHIMRDTYSLWSNNIYEKTRQICLSQYHVSDYWINASLEECAFALRRTDEYIKYKKVSEMTISLMPDTMRWKRKKTENQINVLKYLLQL